MFQLTGGPIIACSTGLLSDSAIGVIRISGLISIHDLTGLISLDTCKIKPRYAHFCNIVDGEKILDEVILTFFERPHSYNGENIVELAVHGNQININRILSYFVNTKKFRMANEGEFTYRALKNKKLSLSQVEGLDLLLNAKSTLALESGLETLHGRLHESFLYLKEAFLNLKSSLEINIDFSEDVGDEQSLDLLKKNFNLFHENISTLFDKTRSEISSLTSPQVILLGQTNAGKSSLFNLLLNESRSIVSETHGTTRDYVSENLFISGVDYRLIDTAGIRATGCEIEVDGILRALAEYKRSFFKILVLNPHDDNEEILSKVDLGEVDLFVLTHRDHSSRLEIKSTLKRFPEGSSVIWLSLTGPIGAKGLSAEPFFLGPIGALASSKIGPIEPVTLFIAKKYLKLTKNGPIVVLRHRHLIQDLHQATVELQGLIGPSADLGVLSSLIMVMDTKIQALIGVVSTDDLLDSIFSNFCIGK